MTQKISITNLVMNTLKVFTSKYLCVFLFTQKKYYYFATVAGKNP